MEQKLSDFTYTIVGLGIMGGSIAKSIRKNIFFEGGKGKIFAIDKNENSLLLAKKQNIIDDGFLTNEASKILHQSDVIFICIYPHATVDFLEKHKNDYKDGALITDISGVKNLLQEEFKNISPSNANLILAHPMAGGEKEGFESSKSEYFENHNYIIITQKENKSQGYDNAHELLKKIIRAMGFSKITETDSENHDNKIGFTSQLCHVVASAMVESAEDPNITSFGGGSFEDLTRIAMINAPLWTELFLANKEKLVNHIETFKKHLTEIEDLIKNDDSKELQALLEDVRIKRIQMQKQSEKKAE